MAGYLIESLEGNDIYSGPLKLLDLGGCEIKEQFQSEGVRGAWALLEWQLSMEDPRRLGNQLLVIEGQPDRLPRPNESAKTWLEGRSGSFRGLRDRTVGCQCPGQK